MSNRANPMYAKIKTIREWKTVCALSLFGMEILQEFTNNNHRILAERWVKKWNAHLDAEWASVRGTSADIMQQFVFALGNAGVPDCKIDAAIKEIRKHADF